MKRKDFLKKGLALGLGGAVVAHGCSSNTQTENAAPAIITDKKFKWKMVTAWPPNFPVIGEGCNQLAEWIYKMSAGRLEINVYGGGELVPPLQTFEAVSGGAVEMGHAASYYWAGIEPAFQFFASIPFGMNAQQMNAWMEFGGGLELWQELYARFNIVPFYAGNTGVQMGGWFNRKIESIDSWRGLKMRMPGLGGKVIEEVGATAVLSPGSELYTNLERGVIDATEWIGPFHDYQMGFPDIAKYYYYPGWHEAGTVLECIVNKRDFDSLPQDLQEIVRTACYRSNQVILSEFEAKNLEYFKKIKEEGKVEILPYPPEVMTRLKEIALQIYEEMAVTDEWSGRAYNSFKKFKEGMIQWSDPTEKSFYDDIM